MANWQADSAIFQNTRTEKNKYTSGIYALFPAFSRP